MRCGVLWREGNYRGAGAVHGAQEGGGDEWREGGTGRGRARDGGWERTHGRTIVTMPPRHGHQQERIRAPHRSAGEIP